MPFLIAYNKINGYFTKKEAKRHKEKAPAESLGNDKIHCRNCRSNRPNWIHRLPDSQGLRQWGGQPPLISKTIITQPHQMHKIEVAKNMILYLGFLAITAYAIRHGVDWSYWACAALMAAVFLLDVLKAVRRR